MAKFDTDNPDHIALFNRLCNKARGHFLAGAYFSDCIRDVEFLTMLDTDGPVYWLVGDTYTIANRSRETILDLFHKNKSSRAVYTITRTTSQFGTVWFDIVLTD